MNAGFELREVKKVSTIERQVIDLFGSDYTVYDRATVVDDCFGVSGDLDGRAGLADFELDFHRRDTSHLNDHLLRQERAETGLFNRDRVFAGFEILQVESTVVVSCGVDFRVRADVPRRYLCVLHHGAERIYNPAIQRASDVLAGNDGSN